MSHFAELDDNNIVIRVIVGNNDDPAGDEGYSWIVKTFGGRWVQTSYSGSFREHFAGIGYTYNKGHDAFIPPQPYKSWVLDLETYTWVAPIPQPDYDNMYIWDESTKSWIYDGPIQVTES